MSVSQSSQTIREIPASGFQRLCAKCEVAGWSNNNLHVAWRFKGGLNRVVLLHALDALVGRHEALRTTMVQTNKGLKQRIRPSLPSVLTENRIRSAGSLDDPAAREVIEIDLLRPFETEGATLCRFTLFSCEEVDDDHVLTLAMEHSICDAESCVLLYHELASLMGVQPEASEIDGPTPAQFREYSELERKQDISAHLDFLHSQLEPGGFHLPCPAPPQPNQGYPRIIRREASPFGRDTNACLATVAKAERATFSVALFSALAVAFSPWTDRAIRLGVVWADRTDPRFQRTIGPLVSILPLRIELSPDMTFADVIKQAKDNWLQALGHRVPMGTLFEIGRTETWLSSSLADVLVNFFTNYRELNSASRQSSDQMLQVMPFPAGYKGTERTSREIFGGLRLLVTLTLNSADLLHCGCESVNSTLSDGDLDDLTRYLGTAVPLISKSADLPIGSMALPAISGSATWNDGLKG